MTTVENNEHAVVMTTEEWLTIRKEAGLRIDPATARVTWWWARVMDPCGVLPYDPEADCVGRQYFVCSSESDVRVSIHDLPKSTVDALRKRRNVDDDLPF
jgi:hypothetical protein